MKELFVSENNWTSYLEALYIGLEKTKGWVYEFGVGSGSTPILRQYCKSKRRKYQGFDYSKEYAASFEALYVSDWESVQLEQVGLLFIDHAPGERRVFDIIRWKYHAQVIVAHDTEPAAEHGYQMGMAWKEFKYVRHFETSGAWATIASNFIDVTK